VSRQHPANAVEYRPSIGEESNRVQFFIGLAHAWKRVEDFVDLSVVIAVLPEDIPKEQQLLLKAVLFIYGLQHYIPEDSNFI
jgi:hypothetical protein